MRTDKLSTFKMEHTHTHIMPSFVYMFLFLMLSFPHCCTFTCIPTITASLTDLTLILSECDEKVSRGQAPGASVNWLSTDFTLSYQHCLAGDFTFGRASNLFRGCPKFLYAEKIMLMLVNCMFPQLAFICCVGTFTFYRQKL